MASANLDLSPACTPAAISFIFGVTISQGFLRTWVLRPLLVDNLFSGVTGLWVVHWAITVCSTWLHLAGPNNNLYPRLFMFPLRLQCDHIINCVTRRHNGGDVCEGTASVLLLTNSCRKWVMDTVTLTKNLHLHFPHRPICSILMLKLENQSSYVALIFLHQTTGPNSHYRAFMLGLVVICTI